MLLRNVSRLLRNTRRFIKEDKIIHRVSEYFLYSSIYCSFLSSIFHLFPVALCFHDATVCKHIHNYPYRPLEADIVGRGLIL
jgi:hypothetical protein